MTHNLTIFLIFLTSVILLKQILAYELTECPRFHTKNITGGNLINGSYHYKDKVYPPGHFGDFNHYLHENGTEIGTETHVRGCICTHSERRCIRVCCTFIDDEDGHEILPEICPVEFSNRIFHETTDNEIFIQQQNILVYDDLICKTDPETGHAYDKVYFEFDFHEEDGSIFVQDEKTFLDYDRHCVIVDPQTHNLHVIMCAEPVIRHHILRIEFILSVPFPLATFIVYAVLPELRNLHSLCLMSYVGSLTVGYTLLATVQLIGSRKACVTHEEECYNPYFCTISGYIIYFSFILSFFWLNTMCFNIFLTFRRLRPNPIAKKNFMYYCVYAWGMATLLTILALSLDISNISEDFKPGMYFTNACFLQDNRMVQFLYFYMILLTLFCANIAFFIATAYRIKKVQSETSAIAEHSKHNDDKFRFLLYLRLFIMMGATWSLQILSWFIASKSYVYVTDLVNCLQGILVFLVVVCNGRVRKLIMKRFNYFIGSASPDTSTRPT